MAPSPARPPVSTAAAPSLGEAILRRGAAAALPFWRAHRDSLGPLRFVLMDMRGAFCPVDRFFYNRIPKSANSTVMRVLTQFSQDTASAGKADKSRFRRPSRMTRAQVRALQDGEIFRFTFVRDPYARVLSAYQDKIMGRSPQFTRHFPQYAGGQTPSFAEFCRALQDGLLYKDAHWAPQTSLLLLPPDRFDLIGRVETFEADIAQVVARIWNQPYAPIARVGTVTKAQTRRDDVYTDETRHLVAQLYHRDFALLGYRV